MRAGRRRRLERLGPLRQEGGFTVVELAVSTLILGVVTLVFTSNLASLQKAVGGETNRSINNDQIRLAMEQLDREIRSANLLYDPDPSATPDGYHLRVYTQSNGVPFRCVEWRVTGSELQRRVRSPGYGVAWPTTWQTIATNVVNVANGVKSFSLDHDPSRYPRTIDVTLWVSSTPTNQSTIQKETLAITGRNTSYGYPSSVCDPMPAD
jgi:type II secretory pathway pseudopilin PulG